MEREQRLEVDVGDAIRVREAEGPAGELVARAGHASSGRRVLTGIEALDLDRHPPILRVHELLDHLAQVARQEHEAAKTLRGVDMDHMPEDRLAADLNQRLRDRVRLLPAGAFPCLRRGWRREGPPLAEG